MYVSFVSIVVSGGFGCKLDRHILIQLDTNSVKDEGDAILLNYGA